MRPGHKDDHLSHCSGDTGNKWRYTPFSHTPSWHTRGQIYLYVVSFIKKKTDFKKFWLWNSRTDVRWPAIRYFTIWEAAVHDVHLFKSRRMTVEMCQHDCVPWGAWGGGSTEFYHGCVRISAKTTQLHIYSEIYIFRWGKKKVLFTLLNYCRIDILNI